MLTGRLGRWLSGQGTCCPNLMFHVQTPEPMERWEAGPGVCVPSVPKGWGEGESWRQEILQKLASLTNAVAKRSQPQERSKVRMGSQDCLLTSMVTALKSHT